MGMISSEYLSHYYVTKRTAFGITRYEIYGSDLVIEWLIENYVFGKDYLKGSNPNTYFLNEDVYLMLVLKWK